MRIKKTSQTTASGAQSVNTYSESTENTYCCDYVNKLTEFLHPELLYDNSQGNTGNISLNENVNKYKKIVIYGFFYDNFDDPSVIKSYLIGQEFYINHDNNVNIQLSWNTTGSGIVYCGGTTYKILGNTITPLYHYRVGLYGTEQGYAGTDNRYAITRVVGYY